MKFYILRKNETIRKQHDLRICPCKCWRQYWNLGLLHCKSADPSVGVDAHLATVVREIRDIIGLPKMIVSPRYKQLGNWEDVATQGEIWLRLTNDFVMFCKITG